jgi:two-component system, response regulator, stage 0 sporulation protein F
MKLTVENIAHINVLLVDDDMSLIELEDAFLKTLGFSQFYKADNGTSAMEIMVKEDIHLIISDIKMPGLNGKQLFEAALKFLKGHPDRSIAFVFCTAFSDITTVSEVKNISTHGPPGQFALGYIPKPFSRDKLINALKKVFCEDQNILNHLEVMLTMWKA